MGSTWSRVGRRGWATVHVPKHVLTVMRCTISSTQRHAHNAGSDGTDRICAFHLRALHTGVSTHRSCAPWYSTLFTVRVHHGPSAHVEHVRGVLRLAQ